MASASGVSARSSIRLWKAASPAASGTAQLRPSGLLGEGVDLIADGLDGRVGGFEALQRFVLGDFLRAGFDHDDAVAAAGDDQVERLCLRCGYVGLMMYSPSMRPTRTPAIVFSSGISESAKAAEAPVIASTSPSFSVSAETTKAMICVSKCQPEGKSGRIGRSMQRLVRTSFSVALPSRLKKPPGMRPGRVGVFAVVDGQRQEVDALARVAGVAGGDEHHRVALSRTTTEPSACLASFPVSMDSVRWPI